MRAAGFQGFNCNLQLVAQSKNEGGSWQAAFFEDRAGNKCGYYDSSSVSAGRTKRGTAVINTTQANTAEATTFLTTTGMLDPWESLKVNDRRQLLGAVNALNGNGGPELDLFDLSGDCRNPQLLSTLSVGLNDGTNQYVAAVRGHEGNFAPDGLTYYAANLGAGYIYPIDITNTTKPRLLTQYFTAPGRVHGLNISEDGKRAYLAILGQGIADSQPRGGVAAQQRLADPRREPGPGARSQPGHQRGRAGHVGGRRGAQHTIDVMINGKPYIIHVDEGGSGGNSSAGWNAACNMNLPAWQFSRIIDISDETKPTVVSKLMLEAYDPKNCAQVLPDLAGLGSFTYGSPLLQRRQQEQRDHAGLRVLQLGHPRVRHPRPGAAEGDRVLQPGRHDDAEPRLESQPNGRMGRRRSRLVHGPDQARCRDRNAVDDVPGQRLSRPEVHQWRVAVPGSHDAARDAELTDGRATGTGLRGPGARVMRFDDLNYRLSGAKRDAARAVVSLAACALPVSLSAASDIDIRVLDCRSNVEVKAQNARLSHVLARLAKALDFQVRMEGADPLINVSMSAPAREVVAALAAEHGSFMIQHASDARCPGMSRVSLLWLAPKATPSGSPPVPGGKTGPVQAQATVVPVTETATPERLRRVEEDAARRKQEYEIYVRRHGKPPPGEPEEAAAP